MDASRKYNPIPSRWERPSPQSESPTASIDLQPQWTSCQQETLVGPTRFRRKIVGVSVKGQPFTRAEVATHHLFASTTLQQREALLALDHEAKVIQLAPMDLREEVFPWKPEEFLGTTILTQFYKLVEFYWTIRLFIAQGMAQRDDVSKYLHSALKESAHLLQQFDQ